MNKGASRVFVEEGYGEMSGVIRVTFHPLCPFQVQSIQVSNQQFGLSEHEPSPYFVQLKFDGIMGLAYPALAEGRGTTALQGLLRAGLLSSPVFSFYLGR